uniref:Uncharacterized protein n=1 Tax=Oryza brachyantha TaxID=4533 RepID=J3NAH7_ORYBR
MPQPAFFRSPPPLPHLQPPRGFHVDLAARHKALLEEDVALKRFKSYKSKAKQVLRARNALTSVVLCVPFGVPYQNNRRIPTMRVYCTADEEVEEVSDLGVNVALSMLKFYKTCSLAQPLCEQEKYRPYYPQAAVMCQLAVVMDMIPQGGLARKSCPRNDDLMSD